MERFAGRFALVRPLGRGGMGEVYLARDVSTGLECALKKLALSGTGTPEGLKREFEALTRVRHPAVVAVHELGFAPDGTPFITMEYVPGAPADRAIAIGDWDSVFFAATQLVVGLEAIHAAGVLHGDLKPSNVLVVASASGRRPASVRVVDFGLAALDQDARGRGTPGFAAPEVVRGEPLSISSDLYSLGTTLYALCVGRSPFESRSFEGTLERQRVAPPSSAALEEAGTPRALIELVLRLTANGPAERPRDAREVRRELEAMSPAARRPLGERLDAATVVGRERELARLEHHLARGGRGARLLWLDGKAGIGKTTLLGEMAARAALAGRPVVRIASAGAADPLAPARTLLVRLAAEAGRDLDTEMLTSGARAFLRGETEPAGVDVTSLSDAAARWVRASGEKGLPPLVLVDDSEQLSPEARGLLVRVLLHPDAEGWVSIWAFADDEGRLNADARALVDAGIAERVTVAPLTRDGLWRLVAARLYEPPPAVLEDFLWERTGGHPGEAVRLLHAAAAAGAIREGETGIAVDAAALAKLDTSGTYESELLRRLERAPAAARAAAHALAAFGRSASQDELSDVDAAVNAGAVDELVRLGIATRDDDGRARLQPSSIADTVLAMLNEDCRRRLHERILARPGLSAVERFRHRRMSGDHAGALDAADEAFTSRADARLAAAAAEVAAAHAPERAADWLQRTAVALFAAGRYADALAPLERSLSMDGPPEARAARWPLLATAYLRSGRPTDVERVVRRALDESPPPAIRSRLKVNDAARLVSQGALEEALIRAPEALDEAEGAGDAEVLGDALLTLGGALHVNGRTEETVSIARRASEVYARVGTRHRLRAETQAAIALLAIGRADEAETRYRDALDVARAEGLRLANEELALNLGSALVEAGRWSEARDAFEEGARIALEDGRANGVAVAFTHLAQLDGLMGRPRLAYRRARAALRLTRAHMPQFEPAAWRALARANRSRGRWQRAERQARRGLDEALRSGNSYEQDWGRIELGRSLAGRGRWDEAAGAWSRVASSGNAPASLAGALATALLGRAELRKPDPAGAASRLESAQRWLEGKTADYVTAHAHQLRAEIALASGRWTDGFEAARQALSAYDGLPAPVDRAMAELDFARLTLADETRVDEPIGEFLRDAAATFGRLGDRGGRERALALRVEWYDRRAVTAPATVARERDLLEAVGALLTSLSDLRELAQRAMRLAVDQLGAERGVLLLADPETGALQPIAEHGAIDAATRSTALGYSRRVVESVTHSGGSLLVSDAVTDRRTVRSDSIEHLGLRSILCVPMFMGGTVVGAVYLDSRKSGAFGTAERGVLEGFAHLMGVAIAQSRGHEEVKRANEELVGENLTLRQEVASRFRPHNLIATSSAMLRVLSLVERAAQTSSTVLLTGENGTGKEMVARVLHHAGKRRLRPFVVVNCGAIPEPQLEAELFGIKSKMATGVGFREGRFVQADGGTLFLDEIGEMPLNQQVALLSVLASREVTPVGGGHPRTVDVRIIAATNGNLRRMIEGGRFREDLFYRLNVIPIEVPPLRDHKADIPALAHHFAAVFAQQQERDVPELSNEFMAALMQSDWPGNVRELQNYVERVMAMTPGKVLFPDPLPMDLQNRSLLPGRGLRGKLRDQVAETERRAISEALERTNGNRTKAARELGINEQALRYRLRKFEGTNGENRRTRRKPPERRKKPK